MTCLAFIHAAQGILYWCLYNSDYLPDRAERWEDVCAIAREIMALEEVLLAPGGRRVAWSSSAIHALRKDWCRGSCADCPRDHRRDRWDRLWEARSCRLAYVKRFRLQSCGPFGRLAAGRIQRPSCQAHSASSSLFSPSSTDFAWTLNHSRSPLAREHRNESRQLTGGYSRLFNI